MYNEKSIKTNDLNLGWITQTIRYTPGHNVMDTTYTETPPSLFPVRKLKRFATRNGGWKGNSFVGDSTLYKTLQNRFNTAWNLAK